MGFIYLMQVILRDTKSGIISFRRRLNQHIRCTWMQCVHYLKNKKLLMGMTLIYESMWQVHSLLLFLRHDLPLTTLTLLLLLLISKMCSLLFSFSLKLGGKILLDSSKSKSWMKRKMKKKVPQIKIRLKMLNKLKNTNFMKFHF